MKVTGWGHFDYDWEKKGQTKQIEIWDAPEFQNEYREIENTIIRALRENGYKFDGYYHQYGKMGTPIINDVYHCTFSMRSWGEIMYDAWDDDGDCMGYCKYAWKYDGADMKTPETTNDTKERNETK